MVDVVITSQGDGYFVDLKSDKAADWAVDVMEVSHAHPRVGQSFRVDGVKRMMALADQVAGLGLTVKTDDARIVGCNSRVRLATTEPALADAQGSAMVGDSGVRRGAYTFKVSPIGLVAFKKSRRSELEAMKIKIDGKVIRKASTEVSF